jgi:hypothetical protein
MPTTEAKEELDRQATAFYDQHLKATLEAVATESRLAECLIGTAFLQGHVLEIDFGSAKSVEVR